MSTFHMRRTSLFANMYQHRQLCRETHLPYVPTSPYQVHFWLPPGREPSALEAAAVYAAAGSPVLEGWTWDFAPEAPRVMYGVPVHGEWAYSFAMDFMTDHACRQSFVMGWAAHPSGRRRDGYFTADKALAEALAAHCNDSHRLDTAAVEVYDF